MKHKKLLIFILISVILTLSMIIFFPKKIENKELIKGEEPMMETILQNPSEIESEEKLKLMTYSYSAQEFNQKPIENDEEQVEDTEKENVSYQIEY